MKRMDTASKAKSLMEVAGPQDWDEVTGVVVVVLDDPHLASSRITLRWRL